jgi:transcription initiation factor IIE alpha subunit
MLFSTLINARIAAFENAINKRFDDMRDLWRAELHRVEGVLDARLKHIEEAHGA